MIRRRPKSLFLRYLNHNTRANWRLVCDELSRDGARDIARRTDKLVRRAYPLPPLIHNGKKAR